MRTFKLKLMAMICLTGIFLTTPALAMEDGILAVVNDDVITIKDLKDFLTSRVLQLRLEGRSPEQIQAVLYSLEKNGINMLIEDKLIIGDANKKGLEIKEEAIYEKLESIKSKYKSEQDFLNALMSDGATVTDLKNKIRDQLKVKYHVDLQVRKKIFVNPQEVTSHYEAHRNTFKKPERINLDSIFVPFADNPDQAKDLANEALALLAGGKNFSDIADKYSKGTNIGTLEKGKMLPSIEEAVFQLNPGDISSVLEVTNGYYILKVNEKTPQQIATLEEVKSHIYNSLFEQKFRKKFGDWLDKLKEDAFIDVKKSSL